MKTEYTRTAKGEGCLNPNIRTGKCDYSKRNDYGYCEYAHGYNTDADLYDCENNCAHCGDDSDRDLLTSCVFVDGKYLCRDTTGDMCNHSECEMGLESCVHAIADFDECLNLCGNVKAQRAARDFSHSSYSSDLKMDKDTVDTHADELVSSAVVIKRSIDWDRYPKLADIFYNRPCVNLYWRELAHLIENYGKK